MHASSIFASELWLWSNFLDLYIPQPVCFYLRPKRAEAGPADIWRMGMLVCRKIVSTYSYLTMSWGRQGVNLRRSTISQTNRNWKKNLTILGFCQSTLLFPLHKNTAHTHPWFANLGLTNLLLFHICFPFTIGCHEKILRKPNTVAIWASA